MMARTNRNVAIEDKDIQAIIFRNFSGQPDNFNPKGAMGNFTVVLNKDKADELADRGLNVVYKENRDGDTEARLKIFVRFDHVPPKVYQITSRQTVELDAETVRCLDTAEISKADLILSPYHYDFNGREGVKAYLSKGYFTIEEDQFAKRYLGPQQGDADDSLPF